MKKAWTAIHAIASDLLNKTDSSPSQEYEAALLFAYLAASCDESGWLVHTENRLNSAIERASEVPRHMGLHGGLCGLAWVVEHVSDLLSDGDNEVDAAVLTNMDIDNWLLRQLSDRPWLRPYDLVQGLIGFGTYFLERWPTASAIRGIQYVIDHLAESAIETGGGITWHSHPRLLPKWQQDTCPDGYYNLGVAHGIPGIIHFLSEVSFAGIGGPRSERLLEGAVQWLMSQERPQGSISRFSAWVASGESSDSRLAWCYGDPGIAAVLLQAGRRMCRADWHAYAKGLVDQCLARPLDESRVDDPPLCHGACGLAQIYNRIYQYEGDQRCREAAIFWLERALEMRQPAMGFGGFASLRGPSADGPGGWQPNPALTDGAIGVALALLAAVTRREPLWDRVFLLSGRTLAE